MGDMPANAEAIHVHLSQTRSFLKAYKATMTLVNVDTKKRKRKKVSKLASDLASMHPTVQTPFDRFFKQLITVKNDTSKLCGKTIP